MSKLESFPSENVCTLTVRQNLCIGCGVCAGVCPSNNLMMGWTPEGLLQPNDQGKCLPKCHACLDVCPFLDQAEDETTLAKACFGDIPGIQHTPETGYYLGNYVGYASGGQREHSASGGLATWLLIRLLQKNHVDGVICVVPGKHNDLFEYKLCRTISEVKSAARSAYYPIEISGLLKVLRSVQGRYVVTCLPCVSKAIRLACLSDKILKSRIVYIVGLVCGQNKNKLFTEYCAVVSGGDPKNLKSIQYRKKSPQDYSKWGYECTFLQDGHEERRSVLGWQNGIGKVWNNFAFTQHPCLFCDDIFAETADISFMDAWLPEYSNETLGTSIVLSRNLTLLALLEDGATSSELLFKPINIKRVIESQKYQVWNKRKMILTRIKHYENNGHVPRKRFYLFTKSSWVENIQEKKRLVIHEASPKLWNNRRSLKEFTSNLEKIEKLPFSLRVMNLISGYKRLLSLHLFRNLKS